MATTTTLAQIRTACYNTIKQPEDCAAYPYALLDIFINKAHRNIFGGTVTDPTTERSLVKNSLPFADRTSFLTTLSPIYTSATATVGASSLSVGTTDSYPSTGALWIDGNIITYTGKTSTSFTGIPASGDGSISFAWASGSQIFALYSLPTDYLQTISLDYQTSTNAQMIRMVGVDYRDVRNQQLNQQLYQFTQVDQMPWEKYFTIVHGQYLLPFIGVTGYAMRLEYVQSPTRLINSTDISSIPDDYILSTVPYLATGEMLLNRGESQEWLNLFKFGYMNVRDMYRFYNTTTKDLIYNQRMRTSQDGSLNI